MAAEWTWHDAWVFAAIEGTGPDDGYTLAQIVTKADGINHAVLLEEEFTGAVPRLLAAGLIGADAEADRYWHTEAGRVLLQRWVKRGGLFGWSEAILPALRRLGPPQGGVWRLPDQAFDRAVQAHLAWGESIRKCHRRR